MHSMQSMRFVMALTLTLAAPVAVVVHTGAATIEDKAIEVGLTFIPVGVVAHQYELVVGRP